jgi:hypothetical protein
MEYKGTWNASTNTPTLANGTGDTGDVYICNVAGTVNFGAGPITFAVGDYVIYSGTIWQRSSGAVGTVTSVALTVGGDAISVSGSPLTTSGTLALAFSGTTSQYIRGNGTLANFPTSLVTGSGTTNFVSKFTTSSTIGSSQIYDDGTSVLIGTTGTLPNIKVGIYSSTQRALEIVSTNANALFVQSPAAYILTISNGTWTSQFTNTGRLDLAGDLLVNTIANATTDTDRFLVSDSGVIKYRTGAELLSDIGGASASGYVPYTGATANLDLGTNTLIAAKGTFSSSGSGDTVGITHSSGSGIALNITKGGNGEGLYINKTSGTGNAATIIGTLNATTLVKSGGTSSEFLKADGSVDSTSYGTGSVTSVGLSSATSGVTIGSTPITTSGTITLAIATASGSQQGLLSSTDWTTFNNKQSALTNPVTGTGTTNYLPKFTGASTIGNSLVQDSGSAITITGSNYLFNLSGGGTSRIAASINNTSGNLEFGLEGSAGNQLFTGMAAYQAGIGTSNNTSLNFATNTVVRMQLNTSGNLGLGVTPSAWASGFTALQVKNASFWSTGNDASITANAYYDGSNYRYIATAGASRTYHNTDGSIAWSQAPSGTAGNAITFTPAMTLNASGRLILNTTDDNAIGRLQVRGNGTFTGTGYDTINSAEVQLINTTSSTGRTFVLNSLNSGGFQIADKTAGGATRLLIDSTGAATFSSSVTAATLIFKDAINSNSYGFRGLSGIVTLDAGSVYPTGWNFQYGGGASSALYINGSGNVGIGTTSPSSILHTLSSSANSGIIATTSATSLFVEYRVNTSTAVGYIGNGNGILTSGGNTNFGVRSENDLLFAAGGNAERMRITSGGNVEINTGSIKTGEPDTGWGRSAIKIGAKVSGEAFNVDYYLPVSVDGTVYYINLNSSTP